MQMTDLPIGTLIEDAGFLIFFGNKNSSSLNTLRHFSNLQMAQLHQIHSDIFIHSKSANSFLKTEPSGEKAVSTLELPKADAHWTQEKNLALWSKSADCIPVLITNPSNGWMAGIHAGWRGVQSEITRKTMAQAIKLDADLSHYKAFIGPHIQQTHFEVEQDVKDQLITFSNEDCSLQISDKKFTVDLNQLIYRQLLKIGFAKDHISIFFKDTFSDPDYHSFRRDRALAGRQISFVAKI